MDSMTINRRARFAAAFIVLALAALYLNVGLITEKCEAATLKAASTVSEGNVTNRIEEAIEHHEKWVYFGWDEKVPSSLVNKCYLRAITKKASYLESVATGQKMTYIYSGTSYASGLKIGYNTAAERKAIKKTVRKITGKLKPGMSVAKKYRVLHDGLIRYGDYKRGCYKISSLLGSKKRGNCYAYALSYVLLCRSAGLKAVYLGSPNNPMSHGWCGVRVKGRWYEVDCSWDDPIGSNAKSVSTRYFLRGRGYMKKLEYHRKVTAYAPSKVELSKADFKMKRS